MIAKCTKGRSVHGALAYDVGPGRAEEHRNPHQVAGNVAGRSWRERAYAMDEHARSARPDVARPVHRTALRLADDDRRLTDKEWRQVAERYVKEMGFQDCPWTAMRHGEEHVHVTVSRVRWDGRLASDAHDFRRSHQAARSIERAHGLVDASERSNPARPQVQSGERARAERTGEAAPRDTLRERLDQALSESAGTREGYEAAMSGSGVRFVANEAKTGRMNGYRYGLTGHNDASGEQVWFKGSQLGRDFTWSATQRRLDEHQAARGVGGREQAASGARSVLDRIKAARGERPDTNRATTTDQPAPSRSAGRGEHMARETGSAQAGPQPAASRPAADRAMPAPTGARGNDVGPPTGAAGRELQPPTGAQSVPETTAERPADDVAQAKAREAVARLRQERPEPERGHER